MDTALQASLLDLADEPVPGPLGRSVRRTRLAHGAWVDIRPGWMAGAAVLFDRLRETVPWREERRRMYERVVDVPRLLCFYAEGEPLPDPALLAAPGRAHRALLARPGRAAVYRRACACTATAGTASPGTVTGSAAGPPRTP